MVTVPVRFVKGELTKSDQSAHSLIYKAGSIVTKSEQFGFGLDSRINQNVRCPGPNLIDIHRGPHYVTLVPISI